MSNRPSFIKGFYFQSVYIPAKEKEINQRFKNIYGDLCLTLCKETP